MAGPTGRRPGRSSGRRHLSPSCNDIRHYNCGVPRTEGHEERCHIAAHRAATWPPRLRARRSTRHDALRHARQRGLARAGHGSALQEAASWRLTRHRPCHRPDASGSPPWAPPGAIGRSAYLHAPARHRDAQQWRRRRASERPHLHRPTTDNPARAIDLCTGKTPWRHVLAAGGQATPMTCEFNGRQHVVMMARWRHFMETPVGDAVIAYALPWGCVNFRTCKDLRWLANKAGART